MTNKSVRLLYDQLKRDHSISYLLTYRLNQDVLENFFGIIRAKGGLQDHPDQLEFMYRLRSYVLGHNEGTLSFEGNTLEDDTPDLESVSNLSGGYFKALVVADSVEPADDVSKELEMLQYDGLEHLAGYICHRIKEPGLCEEPGSTFTWTDQISEGFLKKSSAALMADMEQMELIFNEINGDNILFQKNFVKNCMDKVAHIKCNDKIKRLYFRSRMYFRLKALNQKITNDIISRKRKIKKIIT